MSDDIIIDTEEDFGFHVEDCMDRAEVVYPFVRSLLHDEFDVTIAMALSALIAEVILSVDESVREFIIERSVMVLFDALDEAEERDSLEAESLVA